MKIKKTQSNAVVVEFDEFRTDSDLMPERIVRIDLTIEKMNELSSRRLAYNMWEFASQKDADHALFMLGLKL